MTIRLAKFIADCGVASRRGSEELIAAGFVAVDNVVIKTPVFFVSGNEKITVKGKPISKKLKTELYAYHKPINTITSNFDPRGRKTIFDVMPAAYKNLKYVGRLDYKTTGLLLLTNDGDLARKLTLPSSGIPRTYIATVAGDDMSGLDKLRGGVKIDGINYRPMKIEVLKNRELKITITEGKKNEVRITLAYINLPVVKLHRVSYGNISLGNLSPGKIIKLSEKMIDELC